MYEKKYYLISGKTIKGCFRILCFSLHYFLLFVTPVIINSLFDKMQKRIFKFSMKFHVNFL